MSVWPTCSVEADGFQRVRLGLDVADHACLGVAALTQGIEGRELRKLIYSAASTAFIIAIIFLFTGTALFEFLGITSHDFRIGGGILLLVLVAVGASIGSPATPGVGIVILAMVLGTIGVPASGVALILGVDRVLDMSRILAGPW